MNQQYQKQKAKWKQQGREEVLEKIEQLGEWKCVLQSDGKTLKKELVINSKKLKKEIKK